MDTRNRKVALLMARKLPHNNVGELLANAAQIESYLDSTSTPDIPQQPHGLWEKSAVAELKRRADTPLESLDKYKHAIGPEATVVESERRVKEAAAATALTAVDHLREERHRCHLELIAHARALEKAEEDLSMEGQDAVRQIKELIEDTKNTIETLNQNIERLEQIERNRITKALAEARKARQHDLHQKLGKHVATEALKNLGAADAQDAVENEKQRITEAEPTESHIKRVNKTVRTCSINGTLTKDGDAIMLIDKEKNTFFKMVAVWHTQRKGTSNEPTTLVIDELHSGADKHMVLEFQLRNRPYRIEYDGEYIHYWANDNGSIIRSIPIKEDLNLEPVFLGYAGSDKWETKSERVIVEQVVDYAKLDEIIGEKSAKEMSKWVALMNELPKAAWLPEKPVFIKSLTQEPFVEGRLNQAAFTRVKWSGFADDLRNILNEGNTVLSTARQIGTTTFLTSVAAEQSYKKKVGLVVAKKSDKDYIEELVKSFQYDPQNLEIHTFESFLKMEVKDKQLPFDMVIVDSAANLPYKDNEEMYYRLRLCPHVIVASCPAQETGMFHKLRTEANRPNVENPFVGFDVPWTLPLKWCDPIEMLKYGQKLMENIGERFDNQFLCRFRPVSL
jgi:hypothetical protein